MKRFICKLFGLHREFIPGTLKNDVIEIGTYGKSGYSKQTKFRCVICGGLV